MVDKATGHTYYWNVHTNETTALGDPKPAGGAVAQQQQEQQPGFMGMVAQGMAFGVGSSIAHNAIGSLFGGGGGGGDEEEDGGDDE